MTSADTTPMTCAYHPGRPANLRCNRCDKPICSKCAVLTPVGYRCKECVRGQQRIFETAHWFDFAIAFVVSAVAAALGSLVVTLVGWFIFLVAPSIGVGTAEVVRRAVGRRRSRYLPLAAGVGAALGITPQVLGPLALVVIGLFSGGALNALAGGLVAIVYPTAYAVLMIGALVASLRGIRI
jgi:B-box zinc finger